MAKKKSEPPHYKKEASIPKDLSKHRFYGLELDDDQKKFRDAIWDKDTLIVFCNAASGTGKTTIATATSVLMVEYGMYDGISYIASPCSEREQGFLPGSIEEKSEPYFEPFYQAMGAINRSYNNGNCPYTCCTHSFLRGTNFENQMIIIDEAQNYTIESLRKVLTRLHDTCKVIVIGHVGQIDLIKKEDSGFAAYLKHYENQNDSRVKICELSINHRGWISSVADSID